MWHQRFLAEILVCIDGKGHGCDKFVASDRFSDQEARLRVNEYAMAFPNWKTVGLTTTEKKLVSRNSEESIIL